MCVCVYIYMLISNSISNENDGKVKTLQFGECSYLLQMSLYRVFYRWARLHHSFMLFVLENEKSEATQNMN